jgi:hypothetical protein
MAASKAYTPASFSGVQFPPGRLGSCRWLIGVVDAGTPPRGERQVDAEAREGWFIADCCPVARLFRRDWVASGAFSRSSTTWALNADNGVASTFIGA